MPPPGVSEYAALGASRADVLALVVGQGMTLTGLGVAIELAGAAAASQAIRRVLFGISGLDPPHLRRRDRPAGGRLGGRVQRPGLACGPRRSRGHVTGGMSAAAGRCSWPAGPK